MTQENTTVRGDDANEGWTLIIQPGRGWLDIDIRELIRYRDLVWLFVKRDFVTVYKQTVLGPLWFLIQPLITTIMYSFVFGNLAKISTDGVPQLLFYYGGSMMWTYFSSCFNNASDTFISNAGLFGKVYFPRLAVPLSRVLSNMITLGIQFAMLMCFLIYYVATGNSVRPSWTAFAFPLIVLWLATLGTGLGMIVSSLTTRYRDLRQLIAFGLTLWMYATPIVYPLSQVPARFAWVYYVNPVSAPVELFRILFYGAGTLSAGIVVTSACVTVAAVFIGLVLFSRNERTFVDVV